jgi:hypothetical protein
VAKEDSVITHLRVQVTFLAGKGRGLPDSIPAGRHHTTLAAGSRQFRAILALEHSAQPGGLAVHASVSFESPQLALPEFPRGSQFDLWQGQRVGYGTVLETRS